MTAVAHLLLLNGPNLNLLGTREPGLYGHVTLEQGHERMTQLAAEAGHRLSAFQSNSEAELIGRIHLAPASHVAFILFNPAGFTHTSVALRDALLGIERPFVEVHLSDPAKREPFRHVNFLTDIALTSFVGQGPKGYHLALEDIAQRYGGGDV